MLHPKYIAIPSFSFERMSDERRMKEKNFRVSSKLPSPTSRVREEKSDPFDEEKKDIYSPPSKMNRPTDPPDRNR